MASDFVVGLIVGLLGCLVLVGLVAVFGLRRVRRQHADALVERDVALGDLRQELAEDKETNRRLRHELAVKTPGNLIETANAAEMERNSAISERDQAIEQLGLVERDLTMTRARLTEQETKLRRYREALQEIRLSLEAQGRSRASLGGAASMLDTGEITGDDLTVSGGPDPRAGEPPGPVPVDASTDAEEASGAATDRVLDEAAAGGVQGDEATVDATLGPADLGAVD